MPPPPAPQSHPSVGRNRQPILDVLRQVLPDSATVFEVASGSGEHGWFFAKHMPEISWQPSERDPASFSSIQGWRAHHPLPNLAAPVQLDTHQQPWPIDEVDAIFCANMIHISPWTAAQALLRGAGAHLRPGGLLITYGPYKVDGRHTAPSNEAFDHGLRQRNPDWGVRDLEAIVAEGRAHGLSLSERFPMPANNFVLVFTRG